MVWLLYFDLLFFSYDWCCCFFTYVFLISRIWSNQNSTRKNQNSDYTCRQFHKIIMYRWWQVFFCTKFFFGSKSLKFLFIHVFICFFYKIQYVFRNVERSKYTIFKVWIYQIDFRAWFVCSFAKILKDFKENICKDLLFFGAGPAYLTLFT